MNVNRNPMLARTLLAAGLLMSVAAANAARGYDIRRAQESLVATGMTTAEVQQALGHPAQDVQYRNEPGPTFTYRVVETSDTVFDVDFGADGRVASVGERINESDGGSGAGDAR